MVKLSPCLSTIVSAAFEHGLSAFFSKTSLFQNISCLKGVQLSDGISSSWAPFEHTHAKHLPPKQSKFSQLAELPICHNWFAPQPHPTLWRTVNKDRPTAAIVPAAN